MRKVRESVEAIKVFLSEVSAEMKKTSWPERQELVESTIVVIASVALLSLFVGLSDMLLVRLLRLIIRPG